MAKHKKHKKAVKKALKIREPIVLPFEPTIPREVIEAAVHKVLQEYMKRG